MQYVEVSRPTPKLRVPLETGLIEDLLRGVWGSSVALQAQEPVAGGHFNTSHVLTLSDGRRCVLRVAPGPDAGVPVWRHERDQLQRECAIQGHLQAALPEVVPALLHADFSHHCLPRDWALFDWRPGQVWHGVAPRLTPAEQAGLWQQYGALVARLHAVVGPAFGFPAPRSPHRHFADWFLAVMADLAHDLQEQGVAVSGLADLRALLSEQRQRFDAVDTPRLVHGDLWPRNVLVQPHQGQWRISALLDAERAFWGDPAAEWIFGFLDIPRAFWRAYGQDLSQPEADALWRRRAYQARGALHMVLEGQRFGFDARFAHDQFAVHLQDLDTLSRADAPVH